MSAAAAHALAIVKGHEIFAEDTKIMASAIDLQRQQIEAQMELQRHQMAAIAALQQQQQSAMIANGLTVLEQIADPFLPPPVVPSRCAA